MKKIPFFNYQALYTQSECDYRRIVVDVMSRGAFIMQSDLFSFEENLANYLGVKHVIGVADGTIALMMGLRAASVGSGDEVIVPSHTFVASAAAIRHVGAYPVLVDCGTDHLIDPNDLLDKITERTKAIMPVQLNGRTADMDKIVSIATKFSLKIVEDSAQALGSKFNDRFAGTFGVSGSCSFYPSKTLGCFGDGGAVFTDDDDTANYIRLLRDHGRNSKTGLVEQWGYNSRLDNIQAAILNHKLKSYDQDIARRREIALIYHEGLQHISDLVLPPPPTDSDPNFDIFQNYEVESSYRDELRNYLETKGVSTIIQWGGKMLHQFPALKLNTDVPNSEFISHRFFLLPLNTTLSNDDVYYIIETIVSFYRDK